MISLRAPIYVRGSFQHPSISVDKGVMAMRAGGAIALAARILESSAVLEAMVAERFSNVAGFLTSVGSVFSESIGVRLSMFTFGDDR